MSSREPTTEGSDRLPRSADRRDAGGWADLAGDAAQRLRLLGATDASGRIEYLNPAFETLTGYTASEALGENPRILSSGRQSREFYRKLWRTITSGRPWNGRVVNRRKDGEIYTVLQTITPIVDERGEVTHFVAIHEDVTAQVKAEQQIRHMAEYDYLTDLPNRYTLSSRLEQETLRIARHGGQAALLMLDLDHFKSINDNFGHATGDDLLVEVAVRLAANVRGTDTLARLGGDEFAVLMVNLESLESAGELAARLVRELAAPFELEAQKVYTSVSIGIAVSPPEKADPEELLRHADLALYRVKQEGRNGYRFFVEEMHEEIQLRMALGHDLHAALEHDELFLEYQPQVDLRSRRIVGLEALLRWRHPDRGVVRPADFVPIAESNGLVIPIGDWVLRHACGQVRKWQRSGLPVVPVAVNLSAVQFTNRDFVGTVFAILEETGLDADYLELELTETTLMQSTPGLEESVRALADGGVRIALDDFGKGYSSLDYLRRFPLKKLKIDRSFVRDVQESQRDATILSAVISLATELKLHVIAEGIEPSSRPLEYLLAEGCDEAQGFYFGEPLPAESIARLLAEGSDRVQPPLARP